MLCKICRVIIVYALNGKLVVGGSIYGGSIYGGCIYASYRGLYHE